MSDDTTSSDAPAADDSTDEPQAGTSTSDADSRVGGDDDQLSAEAGRKLRSEAKNLRDRLKAAEAKLSEREKADLSEREQLERDRDEKAARVSALEAEARQARCALAAHKLGVRPEAAEDVAKLLDWSSVDDPDDPKHVERAVRDLLKSKPHLSAVSNGADGGAGRREQGDAVDMNDFLRGRMFARQ